MLLPGPTTLRRLVGHTRDAATQRLWDALSSQLAAGQATVLESLLTVPDGARVSALERLRQGPTIASGKAMVAASNAAARSRIDLERIRTSSSEILRIIASIHTGTVSANDVIRMLAHGGKPTRVGDALAHYGRTNDQELD